MSSSTTPIGKLSEDWSYRCDAVILHNNKEGKFLTDLKAGEIIEMIVDRVEGSLSFTIKGITKKAFLDDRIKEGELYFVCGAFHQGTEFEIVPYL